MARTPIHPGLLLSDELEALGINANQLAKVLGVPANRITQIIKGLRSITADTALRLARWFGTSAEFWMNLQQSYDLKMAEQEVGQTIRRVVKQRE